LLFGGTAGDSLTGGAQRGGGGEPSPLPHLPHLRYGARNAGLSLPYLVRIPFTVPSCFILSMTVFIAFKSSVLSLRVLNTVRALSIVSDMYLDCATGSYFKFHSVCCRCSQAELAAPMMIASTRCAITSWFAASPVW